MKRAELGWLSAKKSSTGESLPASGPDKGALSAVRRRLFLELQWQGRGGKFRHFAVKPPAPRRVTGALGAVAFLALAFAVAGTFSAATNPPQPHFGVGAILNEHTALKARHDTLRERAFDLAEQLYAQVEQGRKTAWLAANTTSSPLQGPCPRPPARDAGDEAIFAWLLEHGARLEAIADELTAGRVEPGVILASAAAAASREIVAAHGAGTFQSADMGSAGRLASPPASR